MKLLTLALLLLSFTTSAQVVYNATAAIPFNSSLLEANSGTAPSTWSPSSYTFIEDRNGNPNSAVKLDAVLDYGNSAFSKMDSSDFTIAFWFRKDGSLWPEKSIFQKKYLNTSDPNNVIYEEYSITYYQVAGPAANIRFKPFTDSAVVNSTFGFIEDSVWHHLAITFDRSDSLHAYLDGQLFNSEFIGNTEQYEANIDSAVLEIGNGNISLDDVYFFKYALNPSEVDELYNSEYLSIAPPWCGPYYSNFSVFPNPSATGEFMIAFEDKIDESIKIQVYDMLGKEVEIVRIQNGLNMIGLQLNEPASGFYNLHIESDDLKTVEVILVN